MHTSHYSRLEIPTNNIPLATQDYHVYIARSTYHYAYARQMQVNWEKNEEKKRRHRKEKKRQDSEKTKKEMREKKTQEKQEKTRQEEEARKGKEEKKSY